MTKKIISPAVKRTREKDEERRCPAAHGPDALNFPYTLKNLVVAYWWPACGCIKYDTRRCNYIASAGEAAAAGSREAAKVDPLMPTEACRKGEHLVRNHTVPEMILGGPEPEKKAPSRGDSVPDKSPLQLRPLDGQKERWLRWCVRCGAFQRPEDKTWLLATG